LKNNSAVHADLVEVAASFETFHPAFDHQQRHARVPLGRIGLRDHDHEVGVDAVGDERLRAVEYVHVAVAHRGGGDAGEIGAGAGLGHRDRGDQLTRRDAREPALRLLVVAVLDEVRRRDVVVERDAEARTADPGGRELVGDHLVEPEVLRTAAAEVLRYG
jgi:hypothetical protein